METDRKALAERLDAIVSKYAGLIKIQDVAEICAAATVLREEGEPVAWAPLHVDGSLVLSATSYTEEDARRKGRGGPIMPLYRHPHDAQLGEREP